MSDDVLDDLPDLLSLPGLFPSETSQAAQERWLLWANEGTDPATEPDKWEDVRPGSPWGMFSRVASFGVARVYDVVGVELLAAAIPAFSYGPYLDRHAQTVDLERLAATAAEGEVTFSGDPGAVIPSGTIVAPAVTVPDEITAEFAVLTGGVVPGGGVLDLPVRATTAGVLGNVGPGAVVHVLAGPTDDVAVANADAIVGGTERETDAELLRRVLGAYRSPRGGGRVQDYVAWAQAELGVREVTVHRRHAGPGTMLVVAMGAGGQPVSAGTLTSLEARRGELPAEPVVTIATSTILNVTVASTVELDDGYTLAGAPSTPSVQASAEAAVRAYVERVRSGGEVVLAEVNGALVRAAGVHDVSGTTINGAAANLAVDISPPEAPILLALNLTVAP